MNPRRINLVDKNLRVMNLSAEKTEKSVRGARNNGPINSYMYLYIYIRVGDGAVKLIGRERESWDGRRVPEL